MLSLLLLNLLPAGLAGAAPDGPLPSDPEFQVRTLDGSSWSARLASFDLDDGLETVDASGARRSIPLAALFSIARSEAGPELVRRREGAVLLAGGDVLPGQVVESDGEVLGVRPAHGPILRVELDRVEGLLLGAQPSRDRRDSLIDAIRGDRRDSDAFWLANGDRVEGTFVAFEGDRLRIEREGRPAELPRAQVAAVGFDPALVRPVDPPTRGIEVHTRSGGRVSAVGARLEGDRFVLDTSAGPRVEVPQDDVERIYARSASFEFLTERKIDAQESVAYVGPALAARVDRAVDGRRLAVGGRLIPRGLGVQSRSLLAYRLSPTDRRFRSGVAVSDHASEWGSIVFRVLLDARPAFESQVMRPGDPPVEVDLDVEGKAVLILIAEFGPTGGTQDEGVWLEPRLVK